MVKTKKQITVKLARLADAIKSFKVTTKTTVAQLLEKAGIDADGDIFVNGVRASKKTVLKNGDVVGIVGQVQGGY